MNKKQLENIELKAELKQKDNKIAAMKTNMKKNDQYLKNTFKYMSKAGKAEFKNSYQLGKSEHPKANYLTNAKEYRNKPIQNHVNTRSAKI